MQSGLRASRTLDKSLPADGGKACQDENGTTSFHLPNRDAREHPRPEEVRPGRDLGGEYTISFFGFACVRKAGIMEFLQSWTFMAIMAVLLLVLIGVLLFLRSKRPEE